MPPLSNRRKVQLANLQKAKEGAKKWRARMKAEKARGEAGQSDHESLAQGPSFESESAGAQNEPRGLEVQEAPTCNNQEVGRRRSQRIRAR
ncbi:unnamed protein product [Rhizoctonia solani]|uniref:Uncharacterized protein n=1 Tax=Rhizoctonia solani TaxID=456999 RepID=A0A8H3A0A4_9AGAM|nr:unnamed protein product [Rhizoctonia solani]